MVKFKEMALNNPLISVIMPAYNVEKYIEKAIESILNQSYLNLELLICDDGSIDKTVEIIERFKDIRISLYKNEINLGNLKTTNLLFSKCQGDYVVLQDADDFSEINRLELLLNQFNLNDKLGIVGSYYNMVDHDSIIFQCGLIPTTNSFIQKEMESKVAPFLYPSIMVKKQVLDKVGGFRMFFNRKGYADFDWMARICEVSEGKNINLPLYNYRKHSDSFTTIALRKKKTVIEEYMHYLMIHAHKDRLNGKKDFFELNDERKMLKIIALKQCEDAKIFFWDKNKINLPLFFKAISNDPFNFKIYKDLFYIIRKKIFNG